MAEAERNSFGWATWLIASVVLAATAALVIAFAPLTRCGTCQGLGRIWTDPRPIVPPICSSCDGKAKISFLKKWIK